MALSTTTNRASFSGNGVTTVFSFPYYFLANADLVVVERNNTTGVETLKTLTTHYTVSGAGSEAGGSVTMLTAPASGTTLTIYRYPSPVQGTDLDDYNVFPADTVESMMDKCMMLAQYAIDQVGRAIQKTKGHYETFSMVLPEILTADSFLKVNANGNGWELLEQDEVVTSVVKAGPSSIGSGVTQLAVTFSTAFSNANYSIVACMSNTVDSSPDFQPVVVTSKSATGFTAKWNVATDTANYKLEWIARGTDS